MDDFVLEMRHITKRFSGVMALDDVTLCVRRGETLALLGENGAGKSTLMKILSGFYPAGSFEGEILLEGKKKEFANTSQSEKNGISMIYQELNMHNELTVAENLFLGHWKKNRAGIVDWKALRRDAKQYLDMVGLSFVQPSVKLLTLNPSQQQLVAIAKALANHPRILVLDEPNSGLDPRARVEMKELLQNLRSMGKTIVISSHILSELAEMCNSIGIMDHGKLVEAGNIEDVMEHVFGGNRIVVSVHGEMEPAVRMLKEHPQIRVESVGEKEIHISHAMKEEEIAQLIAQMIQNGIIVTGFYKEEGNLESLFMQLTGGQEDEN